MKRMFAGIAGMLLCFAAQSSVVMTGSRVVYPAGAKEVSVQLTNNDTWPAAVQVWLDDGDVKSTPQTANAPFFTTPPLFRLAPKAGQTVRLRFTGQATPTDRESLWWLNFMQIPPVQESEKQANQLLVMMRNRVKVFYRPAGLTGSPQEMAKTTRVGLSKGQLWLRNDSGYYLSLSRLVVSGGGKTQEIVGKTIAPWSTEAWPATVSVVNNATMSWLNDQGASLSGTPGRE